MLDYILFLVAPIIAYLLGAIPMGYIVVKIFTGQDVRKIGSGRTGGTNALRAGGVAAGIMTGVGDFLKGFGAVYVARLMVPDSVVLESICAAVAVAGHNWSIFNKFKGGAGTGPNIGAAAAIWPWAGAILFPLVPVLLIVTGYASITSTAIALLNVAILVGLVVFGNGSVAYVGYAVATSIMVAIALFPNYKRLINGTERMIGPRAKASLKKSESQV